MMQTKVPEGQITVQFPVAARVVIRQVVAADWEEGADNGPSLRTLARSASSCDEAPHARAIAAT